MNTDFSDDASCQEIEMMLKQLKPLAPSEELINKWSLAMATAPHSASSEKRERQSSLLSGMTREEKKSKRTIYAFAAALALLGGATAFLLTENPGHDAGLATLGATSSAVAKHDIKNLSFSPQQMSADTYDSTKNSVDSPAAFVSYYDGEQNPQEVETPLGQKTLWLNQNSPHKYIKLDYTKVYQGEDKEGRSVEFSLPASRFILVPDEAY